MLFNSYLFIFAFLPIVVALHYCLRGGVLIWLTLASAIFYGATDRSHLWLLAASILVNYGAGRRLTALAGAAKPTKATFAAAVAFNLTMLFVFKYTNFIAAQASDALDIALDPAIALPFGISFYTFTQIAYLADLLKGRPAEKSLLHYALFVSYFPHLVAGPILRYGEMMPQFLRHRPLVWSNLAVGATVFIIGLFKKVMIADTLALYSGSVFTAAASPEGTQITLAAAWIGALAFTMQIYFDFSGYSDMAIGLSRMLAIDLPINFDSPYKSTSIIDFWRRWHITLSRFLRDYLYIPLGGNRKGPGRRYLNLMATMVLGGMWHGAGWTFLIWGALHGVYLLLNHLWRNSGAGRLLARGRAAAAGAWLATFLAVVVAWVFFRADSLATAMKMLWAMAGANGIGTILVPNFAIVQPIRAAALTVLAAGVALVVPNTQTLMRRVGLGLDVAPRDAWLRLNWTPNGTWLAAMSVAAAISIVFIRRSSGFLYAQF